MNRIRALTFSSICLLVFGATKAENSGKKPNVVIIYEGGTRVPFIVRWPAKVKPGVSNALVSQIDFTASFARLLNIKLAPTDACDSRVITSYSIHYTKLYETNAFETPGFTLAGQRTINGTRVPPS